MALLNRNIHSFIMEDTQPTHHEDGEQKRGDILSYIRTSPYLGSIIVLAAIIIVALFYFRSYFFAATVDGRIITRLSVIRRLEKQAGKNILDSLIAEKLIDIEATKKGITVSEDEIIAQIQQVRDSITGQGGTLEEELSRQGMTEADLREQVILQKKVEKILAESVLVSDEDVDAFLTQNQIVVPEQGGQELRERARVQLKNQKLSQEIDGWLSSLKNSASITYYTEY